MIFEKVKEIIVKQLEVDASTITLNTSFVEDLQADSIDLIELIADFEDAFNVEINEESIEDIKTVKDIVDYFESL